MFIWLVQIWAKKYYKNLITSAVWKFKLEMAYWTSSFSIFMMIYSLWSLWGWVWTICGTEELKIFVEKRSLIFTSAWTIIHIIMWCRLPMRLRVGTIPSALMWMLPIASKSKLAEWMIKIPRVVDPLVIGTERSFLLRNWHLCEADLPSQEPAGRVILA